MPKIVLINKDTIEILNLKKQCFDLRKKIANEKRKLEYLEKQILIKTLNNKMRGKNANEWKLF